MHTPRVREVAGVCLLAFLVLLSYGISRPSVESIFLQAHGSHALPTAWLIEGLVAIVAVIVYSRFATRINLFTLLTLVTLITGALLLALNTLRVRGVPFTNYLLYAWKDVHILFLVELLWSYANSVFPVATARKTYGLFCVCGSLGSIAGNLIVGKISEHFGTAIALWMPVLPFAFIAAIAFFLRSQDHEVVHKESSPEHTTQASETSSYLPWMFALVGTMQMVVTLIDYLYNANMEASFPTDVRTRIGGEIYATVEVVTLVLQALSRPTLRMLGVPGALAAIPIVLLGGVSSLAMVPTFTLMAFVKIASKSLDYSLFRVAKEILYIPLSYSAKTRGKAVVDILTHRVAKAGASVVLIAVFAEQVRENRLAVLAITVLLCVVWLIVTLAIARKYRRIVSREQEMV